MFSGNPNHVSRELPLGPRGERLASVLGGMEELSPLYRHRLDEYLRAIVPGAISLDQWIAGPFMTVKLRMDGVDGSEPVEFGPSGMSDGTIRAAGVLAALFQPSVTLGQTALVGIEEPEIALHPAAAGVLFDALNEASHQVQVIATSQSRTYAWQSNLANRSCRSPLGVDVSSVTIACVVEGTAR